jgi:hemerythrin-like domain-containing protein
MSELTELGKVLHEEHFRILVAVCGLESRVNGQLADQPLDPRKDDDARQLHDLVAALDNVRRHHQFEENVIFPLMRDRGEGDLARVLTADHGSIEPMAAGLRAIAKEILDDGTSMDRWTAFRAAAHALIAEVMRHLQKEEQDIVQRLAHYLDAETDRWLAVKLAGQRRGLRNDRDERPDERGAEPPPAIRRFSPATAAAQSAARRRITARPIPRPGGVS